MKRKQEKITQAQKIKIQMGKERERQKKAGFFDGRFVSRSVECKKSYKRKRKHKNKGYDND